MNDELFNSFVDSGSTSINNLILKNYHRLGMTERDLVVYLALAMYAQKGNTFPMAKELADDTGMDESSIYTIIQGLIKLGIIELKTVMDHHQQRDIYSLTPIFYRLRNLLTQDSESNKQNKLMSDTEELFKKIEVEFGRPLSPIEQEQIHQWIDDDHYSVELIDLALREAVLNQAYSLKYMDRILISWEKSNIKFSGTTPRSSKEAGILMLKDKQIVWAIHQMEEDIGPVGPSLDERTPFQYLISVILSAQATDVSVNKVTPILFGKYPEPKDLMNADINDVEQIIKSVGLFHNKAKNIIKTAEIVHEQLNDVVPEDRKGIMALPGAGRKTANVVLSDVFDQPTFAVDTHVSAISKRLHFVDQKANPLQVEKKIVSVMKPEELHRAHHTMIEYGRKYSMKLAPEKETNQLIIECDRLNKANEQQ